MKIQNKILSIREASLEIKLLVGFLILKPFYFFESGGLQVADFFMFCLFFLIVLRILKKQNGIIILTESRTKRLFSLLFIFLFWSTLLNLVWSLYTSSSLLMSSFYILYNTISLISVILVFEYNKGNVVKYLEYAITFSIVLQFAFSFFYSDFEGGTRATLFFNNPNQLGYYAIIAQSIVIALDFKEKLILKIALQILCVFLSLLSLSKAAMISSFFILSMVGINSVRKKPLFLLLLTAMSVFVFVNSNQLISQYGLFANARNRFQVVQEDDSFLDGRGYSRLFEIKENIIWGVGEGMNDRFDSLSGSEVHSTLISVLVSYGIVGLILFVSIIFLSVRMSLMSNPAVIISLAGILLYWLTHQGSRNTLFWVFLGIVYSKINGKERA